MDIHDIRAKLAKDEPTIGTWLQLPSADVAELMARAGYDWVAVDMEHGSFGRTGLPDIFRAIQCGGAAPFARLPIASKTAIKAALEAGAQGLIFPMIESREQLDQAISWATYPGHDDGIFCQSVQTILILFYVIRHLFSPGLLLIHLLCLLLSPYKKTDTQNSKNHCCSYQHRPYRDWTDTCPYKFQSLIESIYPKYREYYECKCIEQSVRSLAL